MWNCLLCALCISQRFYVLHLCDLLSSQWFGIRCYLVESSTTLEVLVQYNLANVFSRPPKNVCGQKIWNSSPFSTSFSLSYLLLASHSNFSRDDFVRRIKASVKKYFIASASWYFTASWLQQDEYRYCLLSNMGITIKKSKYNLKFLSWITSSRYIAKIAK